MGSKNLVRSPDHPLFVCHFVTHYALSQHSAASAGRLLESVTGLTDDNVSRLSWSGYRVQVGSCDTKNAASCAAVSMCHSSLSQYTKQMTRTWLFAPQYQCVTRTCHNIRSNNLKKQKQKQKQQTTNNKNKTEETYLLSFNGTVKLRQQNQGTRSESRQRSICG